MLKAPSVEVKEDYGFGEFISRNVKLRILYKTLA